MPSVTLETGFSGTLSDLSGNSKEDVQNTINRLEQERDKFKKEREQSDSDLLDKRINNLENRISNLQKRLDKLNTQDDECETCKNRRYQDQSDDPGVSFKSASKIAPGMVSSAVRGHEQEHVVRERAKAEREGREVVSQNVIIKTAICPECGKSYVAGGETITVTKKVPESNEQPNENTNGVDGAAETDDISHKVGENRDYGGTFVKANNKKDERFEVGNYDEQSEKGRFLNVLA